MPNGNNGGFPKFPSLYTEEDQRRKEELERLAERQRQIYQRQFVPGVWERKPTAERVARRIAERAIAPPGWLRGITPWAEPAFTPEQADIYIRETEEELSELKRRQQVAERTPPITDYMTAMAISGLLTGEEAQLYELIPELSPTASPMKRLELTEEERQWFLDFAKEIAGKSSEEILRLYSEQEFPAPKTIEELLRLIEVEGAYLDPRQTFATVEFIKDSEGVVKAIREAFPSQVPEGINVPYENIKTELRSLGLEPTGDVKKDIEALEKARGEQLKITGKPDQVTLEDGTRLPVVRKEDGFYDTTGRVKVANIDPKTGGAVPLSEAEEFELDNAPPEAERMLPSEYLLTRMFHTLDKEAIDEFYTLNGDVGKVEDWLRTHTFMETTPKGGIKQPFIERLAKWSIIEPSIPDPWLAYEAGWGDVMSVAGGAAKWMGEEGVADVLHKEGHKLQRVMPLVADLSDFRWTNMFNPRYWTTPEFRAVLLQSVRTIPFALSLLPAALLGWTVGAPVGVAVAAKWGLGAFGTKLLSVIFGGATAAGLSRPMESAMEAGSAFDRTTDMGGSLGEADEVADKVFWDNMKLTGLDAAQIAVALAPLPSTVKVFGRAIRKNVFRLVRVGGRMTIVGGTEAWEEYYQTSVIRRAEGQEDPWAFDSEAQLAFTLGGIMGLGMGAGGDFLSSVISQTEEHILPSQKEKFDADVAEVGEKGALDKLAETPAGAKLVEEVVEVVQEQQLNREIKNPKKRVSTKEIKFLENQLVALEKESAIVKASHKAQSEKLVDLKEAKAPAYEITELQENVKNLEGILSELNTKRASIQSKLGVLGKVVSEAVVPTVPEVITEESWSALPYSSRVALADSAGIARTAAKLSWENLTDVQRERLEVTPIPKVAPVAPEVLSPEDEVMGKAFEVKAAAEQAARLEGYQEAVVTIEDVARTAREALEHIDVHFFQADGSNPLDIAATAAWKLGSIGEYVRLLPDNIYENVSQEFKDAEFADVAEWNLNSMDTIRAFTAIDRGHFGGVARRKVLSVTERLHMAYFNIYGAYELRYLKLEQESGITRPAWYKFRRRKKFNADTFALMENISQEAATVETSELLQRDAIKEAVKDYPQEVQESMVNWAKGLRSLWDEVITEQNAVRDKLGLEQIEYRDNYVSWVYEPNIWSRFLGLRLKPDFVRETAVAPDFIKPTEPFVAHALAREGGLAGYTKIKDVRKLFLDYADTASRDMLFTPIVMNAKAHAAVLRGKGFRSPSQWILDWATEGYAGMPSFISRAFRKSAFSPLRRPLITLRRNLTRAVFPLNWSWNFFVQTSSIALTIGQNGINNTILGTEALWNPSARKYVQEELFSHIIKKRAEGSMVYQDLGATISRFQYVGRTPLQTAEWATNYLTRLIEQNITAVSCYAAYHKGKKMGLTGRALIDYSSEGGAKSQSMYNLQNVPGTIRSPEVGAVFPFQTFCFEAMNFVRELSGVKHFRAGAYETIAADSIEGQGILKNRVKHFLEFMAAIYVLNMVGDWGIDRRPWQPTSFIPFVGIMMSGLEPFNPWNYPMPIRYMSEFTRARNDIIEYGNWSRLRAWILKYHALGGVQISRTIDGIIATIEGEVKDVSGEVMYELEDKPSEYIRAIMMGVYQTEAGREFRARVLEGEPTSTVKLVKDLVKIEEQLGDSVKGRYYTLGRYGTESLSLIGKEDIPQWQILGEDTGYPLLVQFRLYCDIMWEEYNKIPTEDRIKYRRNNPYIDASLYFWEKVKTIRSDEAVEELEKLFKMFIEGNPRAHWRGLPVIPEEIKLLPD